MKNKVDIKPKKTSLSLKLLLILEGYKNGNINGNTAITKIKKVTKKSLKKK